MDYSFTATAAKQIEYWKKINNRLVLDKIKNLIIDISSNSLYFYPLWIFLFSLSNCERKKAERKMRILPVPSICQPSLSVSLIKYSFPSVFLILLLPFTN